MFAIKAINEYGPGRFLIHYEKASCCSFTRHSFIVYQDKKPTEKQALDIIKNGTENK